MLSVTQEKGVVPKLKQEVMKKMIEQGVRIDNRGGLNDYRALSIRVGGVVKTADGSSLVSLGNTKVMAGVKVEIGKPFEDTPDEGALIVNLEIAPTASPDVEPGPPDENAIEVARVVDRAIRHSGFLNFKSLSIVTGKHAWFLWVDVYVLNHDGNLVDASTIAAVTALMNTALPKVELDPAGNILRIDRGGSRSPLSLNMDKLPLTITHVKIGNFLLVDPIREEEDLSDGAYITGVAGGSIVSIQKVTGAFTKDEVNYMVSNSINQYVKLRESVINIMKNPPTDLQL